MSNELISTKYLLKVGVHLGHNKEKWNDKMWWSLLGVRNNISIINLDKTIYQLKRIRKVVNEVARNRGNILFVGTDTEISKIITIGAKRCSQYYIGSRWVGGMLTNWKEIFSSIDKIRKLEKVDNWDRHTSPCGIRKYKRLKTSFGGLLGMHSVPDLIFLLNVRRHKKVIEEANKLNIPVIAVVDSNSDPLGITYAISGNDDSLEAIYLYSEIISNAVLEGLDKESIEFGKDICIRENGF